MYASDYSTHINQSHGSFHVGAYSEHGNVFIVDDCDGAISGICCMHVVATHSRVIPLKEKSFKKFKECANLWKIPSEVRLHTTQIAMTGTVYKRHLFAWSPADLLFGTPLTCCLGHAPCFHLCWSKQ